MEIWEIVMIIAIGIGWIFLWGFIKYQFRTGKW